MKKKILLVDDDPDMLTIFETMFSGAGYKVLTVLSGKEAIKVAEKEQPDLIVLDIRMPEMDGVVTTDILRDSKSTRDIPIVYLSSLVRKDQVDQGHVQGSKIGDIYFIPKTASPEEILAAIKEKIGS